MVEFCPNCKSAIVPEEKNGQVIFACSRCGYASGRSRKIVRILEKPDQTVYVIEKGQLERQ
jgi:DNA-directed RNA polymerase subunit M/transcription elongation factor TFIIS